MATPLTIRGITNNKHQSSEYAIIDIYIPSKDLAIDTPTKAVFHWEVYIVNNL